MSASALTYPIGPLTPPSARLPSEAIGSQVSHQTSSSTSDGASAVTPPGNPPIKVLGVASQSVTITLSATAQQTIAQQQQALDQLRQLNVQLRTSNHDAAAARLQHLLQEFHALQQFGTASARALAALAKEISAAAADLSAGGGNGAVPTTETSFAGAGDRAPDGPANAQGDEGSAASTTSPAAVGGSDVPQVTAGTPAAPRARKAQG
jgi:TolA-binding protein